MQSRRRFIPSVETLENRWCPAVSINVVGNTMTILGDAHANVVTISDNGQGTILSASITSPDGNKSVSNVANIRNIVVRTAAGADQVNYSLTQALTTNRNLTIDLGAGDDQATLNLATGISNARFGATVVGGTDKDEVAADFGALSNAAVGFLADLGAGENKATLDFAAATNSNVGVAIHGGREKDIIGVDFNADITNSHAHVLALLNKGDDSFTGTLAGNVNGRSHVTTSVHGADGVDTIGYTASNVNIAANAFVGVYLEGGLGGDNINATYSGELDGKLNLIANGGFGDDTLAVNLTANSGSTGRLDARVFGGPGNDNMTFNVINSGSLSRLDAVLYTFLGSDTVVFTAGTVKKRPG